MKPYLLGEIYSIQPIQEGKSSRFLKNPENIVNGSIAIGAILTIAFGSAIKLPNIKANDEPQKESPIVTKKWKRICPIVKLNPTIK